jgi:uncharacterized protein YndB with AHSA1/START domain
MATLSHKVTVNAPQERLFQALSTVEGLRGWYTPKIEGAVDKDHEAVFRFTDEEPFRWKFIEIKPNSLVRWKCIAGPGEAVGTTVTFGVSGKGAYQSVVECDHEGWPDGNGALKTCNTLWGMLMGHLKKYAETGHADPVFN